MRLSCQELVVGSGPAGSVTAGLLAEAGRDVIVVEEGPEQGPEAPLPFSPDEMAQCYRHRGLNPSFGKPKIAFAEGCCLGGGSQINSALYHRTPDEALERWRRAYGLLEAGTDEMRPHFEAVESSISVRKSPGPIPTASRKLQEGADALGWSCIEVPRWVRYASERHPDGSPVASRITMAKTWIPRARKAGGQIFSSTRLVGLERSGGGWLGTARDKSGTIAIRAGHVFLCGGAVQTPLLLRRSGIRRNVGNSLAMHPTIKVVALFDEEVNYPELGVPFQQVREFAPRMSFGCSISSPPHLALAMLDHPEDSGRVLQRWTNAGVYYVAVTGPATGKVRRVPVTGDAWIRYQVGGEELRDLAAGMRRLCRLLLEAGAVELFPTLGGCGSIRSADDLKKLPDVVSNSRTNLMSLHVFCSCPMGERREATAVDSWGRVWDAPGLSIHDASVLCDAPGVNPQGSVMAFAHRNTKRYLEGYGAGAAPANRYSS